LHVDRGDGDARLDEVPRPDRSEELQILLQVDRAMPGQLLADDGGDQRAGQQTMGYPPAEYRLPRILLIEMHRIMVTRNLREERDHPLGYHLLQRPRHPDLEVLERDRARCLR